MKRSSWPWGPRLESTLDRRAQTAHNGRRGHSLSAREDRLVNWLRRQPATGGYIGDDAALLPGLGECAVTVDSQREGVHFPSSLDPSLIARRLLAVNLSDLAAVGAKPTLCVSTLAAPSDFPHRRFFSALLKACDNEGTKLVGGDLSRSRQIECTLTLFGRHHRRGKWLRRSAAKAGDRLWIAGSVGEAGLGLELTRRGGLRHGRPVLPDGLPRQLATTARKAVNRYLEPVPQLVVSKKLAQLRTRVAAIDLSDGLGLDLTRLCKSSGVGCRLDCSSLLTPSFLALCDCLEIEPRGQLLRGGDDYGLLFTLPPEVAAPGGRPVGWLTRDRQRLVSFGDRWQRLPACGWDHLRWRPKET